MAWGRSWARRRRLFRPYVSSKIKRKNNICNLSNTPELYFSTIFKEESLYISTFNRIFEVIRYSSQYILTDPRFSYNIGKTIIDLFETKASVKKSRGAHDHKYAELINMIKPYLTCTHKSVLVSLMLQYCNNFYPQTKKEFATLTTEFIDPKDSRAFDILRVFYRNIKSEDFDILISKITDGFDNPIVQNILNRTKLFENLKYNEEDIKDPKERIKFIKTIAKTPTLVNRLKFDFHMTVDDIKNIAPAMRFNFLQYAFKHEIESSQRGWRVGRKLSQYIEKRKEHTKATKLVMPEMDIEIIKELLFAVCLKKHDEFSKWLNLYKLYRDCLKSDVKVDVGLYE